MPKRPLNESPLTEPEGLAKIRKALEDLGEHWMWQQELMDEYRVTKGDLSSYGRFFGQRRVKVGRRIVWAGTEKAAEKIREQMDG